MELEVYQGDILESGANLIAHQVNCKGVMGTGLAKQIKAKYPEVYKLYKTQCDLYGEKCLGMLQLIEVDPENDIRHWVANLFGQNGYGRDRCYTDYLALDKALAFLARGVQSTHPTFRVAIPYNLGCGAAGGDWSIVHGLIRKHMRLTPCRVELWRLDK